MIKRFSLGVLAYLVPTFALGAVWHLSLFQRYYVMTSVPDYLVIETAFTVVQWVMVGLLTTFALSGADRKQPVAA